MSETYYRVSPMFWVDPMVQSWDEDARTAALYLLTCPHRTMEGLFRFAPAFGAADLGWDQERFDDAFRQLINDDFVRFDDGAHVVLIVKALKWQYSHNPNQAKAAVSKLELLPDTPLKADFRDLTERYAEALHEALPEGFGEGFEDTSREGLPSAPTPTPDRSPTPETQKHMSQPDGGDVSPLTIVDASDGDDPDRQFEEFWDAYPRHADTGRKGGGATKSQAKKRWSKMDRPERIAALEAVDTYAAEVEATGQYPAHATTWLNQGRWETYLTPAAGNGRSPPSQRVSQFDRTEEF